MEAENLEKQVIDARKRILESRAMEGGRTTIYISSKDKY